MKTIAITGGIASGKTTLSNALHAHGFPVFNCDDEIQKLYHNPKVLLKIKALFPNAFTGTKINKEKLKQELTKSGLKKLESILYPSLIKGMKEFEVTCRTKGNKVAFFEVPLLLEKNWLHFFDNAIVVTSNKRKRQKQFIARGGNRKSFQLLNNAQWNDYKKIAIAKKLGLHLFDAQSFAHFSRKVEKLLQEL